MIKKLYEKSEIWFAVAWIIGYCVLASIGDNMSMSIGIMKSVTLPILIVLSTVLYLFVLLSGNHNYIFLSNVLKRCFLLGSNF